MNTAKSVNRLGIVVPVYNRKEFLFDALNSLFAQRLADGWEFEIIVVDDGSQDGLETDTRLPKTRPGFHFIRQVNAERGAARNTGARFAVETLECNWLLFFDSDDAMVPNSLTEVTSHLTRADENVVALSSEVLIWDGKPIQLPTPVEAKTVCRDLSEQLLDQTLLCIATTVMRSKVFESLGGFSENREMSGSEDFQLLFRLGQMGPILFLPRVTLLYRRHPENTHPTRFLRSTTLAALSLKGFVEDRWPGKKGAKAYARLRNLVEFCKAGALSSGGFRAEALGVLSQVLRHSPGVILDKRFWTLVLSLTRSCVLETIQLKRRTAT